MAEKTGRCQEFILAVNGGRAFVTVADAERSKQVSMYGLSAEKEKKGHCREAGGGGTAIYGLYRYVPL